MCFFCIKTQVEIAPSLAKLCLEFPDIDIGENP